MTTSRSGPRNPRTLLTPAALYILLALADGDRHGYAVKRDVESRTGGTLRLGPATLYEAIHRMRKAGWIAEVAGRISDDDRRKVYTLTREGRKIMTAELERLATIVRHARARSLLPARRRS